MILGLWFGTGIVCKFIVEVLWFSKLNYLQVFGLRLATKILALLLVSGVSLFFLFRNLVLAKRLKYPKHITSSQPDNDLTLARRFRYQITSSKTPADKKGTGYAASSYAASGANADLFESDTGHLLFQWLVPVVLALSLFIGFMVIHYSQVNFEMWRFATSEAGTVPIIPSRFRLDTLWQLIQQLFTPEGQIIPYLGLAGLVAIAISLLIYPFTVLSIIALGLSLEFGFIISANWSQLLLFLRGQSFVQTDPLFNHDIGFYVFSLPIWQLLEFWLVGLFLFCLLAVALIYLLSGNSLSEGIFPGFSDQQQKHLSGLSACVMLAVCIAYWVSRYELLYSTAGSIYGAAYTEVHVQVPAYTVLALLAGAIALFLFWKTAQKQPPKALQSADSPLPSSATPPNLASQAEQRYRTKPPRQTATAHTFVFSLLPIPYPVPFLVGFLVLSILSTTVLPWSVQRFIVQPNELTQETPYIKRTIALTREAFDLEQIQVENFNPINNLTYNDLLKNEQTVRNIRLWDTRPLLQTNRQLQQIRPYYRFFDADIDRYILRSSSTQATDQTASQRANLSPQRQQVLISPRELDFNAVPQDAQTWVNEHLVYTHGYGFTMSPVNQVAVGGLPYYFVRDIGTDANDSGGNLNTSSETIRASIPIGQPRIYFGELTDTYIMTNTKIQELDYPRGNDNAYNTYDGTGGIGIGAWWKRMVFARYLLDWQMTLTDSFKPETKVVFRRNVNDRIRAIAPFLRYDQDPYLVTADIGCIGLNVGCTGQPTSNFPIPAYPNYLYWVIDAYTVSDHYPYSQPSTIQALGVPANGREHFNYIRNSVKVVIDAYNGSVSFYIANPTDPIIQTWSKIFPNLFKSLDEMPQALQNHIRYPVDLFSIQSERLMTYHMTDPQVFYNQEDVWEIPNEIYGSEPQPVDPYFLNIKLPTIATGSEEFILLLPYRPRQRTNLIAWLAARSDEENYGKRLLYVFPRQRLIFGIEQIEARINQDPVISQKISLWNRQGSRVLQGNLLVIPIEKSLLYVEPLYLVAEQNSLPTLVSVVVAYENQIAMADSLDLALKAVFQPDQPPESAIVRPVE